MSEMRFALHREIPEAEDFRRQWDGLVQGMERPEIFYTWEWAQAVWRGYAPEIRPLLFAGYRDEKLAGIAALVVNEKSEVSFLTAATADYCDFISTPDDRAEWIGMVLRQLSGMGLTDLRLGNLPADSASAPVLQAAARKAGYSVFTRPGYLCAQVRLNSPEDRERMRKTASHKLKRMTKAAAELRTATAEHKGAWEDFSAEFSEFAISHVERFLAAGEVSNLVRQERRAFLTELARLLSAQGWLAFSTLRVGGRSIAWSCGFRFAGSWFYYQPTFGLADRRLSPGSYLLCRILQDAAADSGTRTVDLGLGDEGYKQQYANGGRQTLHITASRSKARLTWEVCRYRGAALVKRLPKVERVARSCVAGLAAMRTRGIPEQLSKVGLGLGRMFSDGGRICFMEWVGPGTPPIENLQVLPLSTRFIASAAMQYERDDETLRYLSRSGKRLQSGEGTGFALVITEGAPVHFCWVGPLEGFKMRGVDLLKQPALGAVVIWDAWTPQSRRGGGYGVHCASLVASVMHESGKQVWIAAPMDTAMPLERAGFVQRFSLAQKAKMFFGSAGRLKFTDPEHAAIDLQPAA